MQCHHIVSCENKKTIPSYCFMWYRCDANSYSTYLLQVQRKQDSKTILRTNIFGQFLICILCCFIILLPNVYFNFFFKNTLVQQTCQLKGRVLSLYIINRVKHLKIQHSKQTDLLKGRVLSLYLEWCYSCISCVLRRQ